MAGNSVVYSHQQVVQVGGPQASNSIHAAFTATHLIPVTSFSAEEVVTPLVDNGRRGPHALDFKSPAGVKSGEKMRVKGKGHAQSGRAGDLFLKITVASNPEYIREDDDLVKTFDVPLVSALFGDKIAIATLEKEIKLKVPQNTKNGQRFRVKEMGAMNRKTKVRGNLYLKANIVLPNVDELDEDLVEMMKEKLPKD